MRHEVLWAIRDSRALTAAEKAFLYAVETRGTAYGTWKTVAADAGMKKDAYYDNRRRLEARGVLSVTERPGRTTVHQVNADWFRRDTLPGIPNDRSGNPAMAVSGIPNDRSGNPAIEEDYEGYPERGTQKVTNLLRAGDIPFQFQDDFEWMEYDLAPLSAWDRVRA